GWTVANYGNLTVALDITVTEDLRNEGIARELVNRIQNIRKSENFDITDKIIVRIAPNDTIAGVLAAYNDYIAKQILAQSIELDENVINDSGKTTLEIDDLAVDVVVCKV
ncbi:MAG: hypothetical protein K2J74_01580, partial [Muribaculaceae bacterium]|nr:hypothetical protein [Muribaculaceae bacterium]